MRRRILAIDDNIDIRNLLRHVLSKDFDLVMEDSGDSGLKAAVNFKPDLIILDLGLPEMDGLELCERFRKLPDLEHTPIIILSGQTGAEIHAKAYSLGADNYLEKPFNAEELIALINSKFRKSIIVPKKSAGHLTLDFKKNILLSHGERVDLTPKEFKILSLLWDKVGEVVSRDDILSFVWEGTHVSYRVIDNHITALRKKVGAHSIIVESIYGEGYQLIINLS
jgi:two-component system alkaline phosphatase synthesis response regulator PhoP